jgi:small subunit ribosomal protein S1
VELKNDEMEKLYAETFHSIREGSILKGKVLSLRHDGVIIDIGYKSEGFIPIEEFSGEEIGKLQIGDDLEVFVEKIEDAEGMLTLSKERATKIKIWEMLENALRDGVPVEGKIVGKTKGGFSVDISGVTAFLPGSQVDIKPLKDVDTLVGKKLSFRVLKLNNKLSNVIVSRRAILEEEMRKKKAETLEKLREGQIMNGVIKNITDYGVFVDLGGIDGLLHISDISWGRINHPSEFFVIGDEISVIVLKYDEASEKVTLGYKQKKPDPWTLVDEKYPVGKRERLSVSRITAHSLNLRKDWKDLFIYPK